MEDVFYFYTDKLSNMLTTVDNQVTMNLRSAQILTRSSKSNGLWCCILLPIILNVYMLQYPVSPLYKIMAILSIGMMCYSILIIVFLSISCMVLEVENYGGCIASALASVILMYTVLGHNLLFSFFFSVLGVFSYSSLLRYSLTKYQSTFTIGEAMVLSQSVILVVVQPLICYVADLDEMDEEMHFISTIIYIVLATVSLIVSGICALAEDQRNLKSLTQILGFAAAFAVVLLHSVLGLNIIPELWQYLFVRSKRGQLYIFWASLLGISIAVLTIRTRLAVKATTVMRKAFHISASLVFMSGILLDENLMFLAAGIVLGLLLLAEALRKSNIEPISSALQAAFEVYSDEKDSGCFAVTPLYLYYGLACPLALVPAHAGRALERLSGVLAIGVGDTAASWFGSKYGFNKWAGGDRTYEGTVFNILSQVATVYTLTLFEFLNTKNALIRASIAATITGLVEAKTNQIDNLVLPLVTIIAFQCTWFLCW